MDFADSSAEALGLDSHRVNARLENRNKESAVLLGLRLDYGVGAVLTMRAVAPAISAPEGYSKFSSNITSLPSRSTWE